MNQLESLKQFSTVVADTGDFRQIAAFAPQDATTNPSLILKAAQKPEYTHLVTELVTAHATEAPQAIMDRLLVRFGCEILALIPGRVSTEVDARLSFDRDATVTRARRLIALYGQSGVARERVLIKIASTWEGIEAAAILQREGIRTNLTLLFSLVQALACAQAQVQLISPFVGRIYDWAKKQAGSSWDEAAMAGHNDPGVQSVRRIYAHYRANGVRTEIMGASFRNVGQILALAGCDLLTISPDLLAQLAAAPGPVVNAMAQTEEVSPPATTVDEAAFRLALNADAMATEKLAEGIRAFIHDSVALEQLISKSPRPAS